MASKIIKHLAVNGPASKIIKHLAVNGPDPKNLSLFLLLLLLFHLFLIPFAPNLFARAAMAMAAEFLNMCRMSDIFDTQVL